MEKFWAVILIFVVVAAAGLMYVNQVYNPQKDSQLAMADTANQTLSAVKSDVEDTAPSTVTASNVINTVSLYCKEGNTIDITVRGGGDSGSTGDKLFTVSSNGISSKVNDLAAYYVKKVTKDDSGNIEKIVFTMVE